METVYGSLEVDVEDREHVVRIHESTYHHTNIKIVELDHQDSFMLEMPKNWRKLLKEQIDSVRGAIVPEYCIPELENTAFRELGSSGAAMEHAKEHGIASFFGFVARIAGEQQRKLVAVDPAYTNVYEIQQMAEMEYHEIRRQMGKRSFPYFGNWKDIKSEELSRATFPDSRRLITARGLMQYSLQNKLSQIIHINSPVHAERINNYIKRQIEWETKNKVVLKPSDMTYKTPWQEFKKMVTYHSLLLTSRSREYEPILQPLAYKIDILLNDSGLEDNKIPYKLRSLTQSYLELDPETKFQRRFRNNVEQSVWTSDLVKLRQLLNTNKFGWKKVGSDYIY